MTLVVRESTLGHETVFAAAPQTNEIRMSHSDCGGGVSYPRRADGADPDRWSAREPGRNLGFDGYQGIRLGSLGRSGANNQSHCICPVHHPPRTYSGPRVAAGCTWTISKVNDDALYIVAGLPQIKWWNVFHVLCNHEDLPLRIIVNALELMTTYLVSYVVIVFVWMTSFET